MNSFFEKESWLPAADQEQVRQKLGKLEEVRNHLAQVRDSQPLSENQCQTIKFYRNLFAEHFGGGEATEEEVYDDFDGVDTATVMVDQPVIGVIEKVAEDSNKPAAVTNKTPRSENDCDEALTWKQFVDACGSNSLDSSMVCQACKLETKEEGFKASGLKNLMAFLSSQSEPLDEPVGLLLKRLFQGSDGAKLMADRGFQGSVLALFDRSESVATNGLLLSWIDDVMRLEGGEDDAQIAAKFVHAIIAALKIDANRTHSVRSLIRNKAVCEFSLAFLDTILLKENLIAVCGQNQDLIFQLAQQINGASQTEPLTKSSKLGTYIVGCLKKLPNEIPKASHDLFSNAIKVHKSFLKKAASAELQKHSPV